MRTLIVPCAGSRRIGGTPLFLAEHPEGGLLGIRAIQGISPHRYDRIIYTVLEKDNRLFQAGGRIRAAAEAAGLCVEIVCLSEETSGPAETVYRTLLEADVEGEFAVRDSHAYLSVEGEYSGNCLAGLDLTRYEKSIDDLRSKSFITANEQHQVLDVVEKHFCSDIISAGLYCFRHAEDFMMAYRRLGDPAYGISKLYLSHVISYLIGYARRVFHVLDVKAFEDWSTGIAWQAVLNEAAEKKVRQAESIHDAGEPFPVPEYSDIRAVFADLDGTLVDTRALNWLAYREAMGKYGYELDYRYYCRFCNGRHYLDFLPQITTSDQAVLHAMHEEKKRAYARYLSHARLNVPLVNLLRSGRALWKTALVTTASRRNAMEMLAHFQLEGLFDLVLTREDVSRGKPDPEGYVLAMKRFNVSPQCCLVYEDSPVGVQAAEASGAGVIVVKGYS